MPKLSMSSLRERLLRAGVAPRHVRRLLDELRVHHEDLAEAVKAGGSSHEAADEEAHRRLGNEDALVAAIVARPELKSWGYRWPALICGLAPTLLILLSIVGVCLLIASTSAMLKALSPRPGPSDPRHFIEWFFQLSQYLVLYGLPLLWSITVCVYAARRRLPVGWLLAGVLIAAIVGALTNFGFDIPTPGHHGSFGAGIGFSTKASALRTLAERSFPTIVLSLGPWLVWRLTRRRDLPLRD